ncbi:MAG: transposase family protein [Bacteroidetes bacterium]|nr:transposase family protein [Bacteroidota bacterium]
MSRISGSTATFRIWGALVCPETRETWTLYDHRKARTWRHLDCHEFKCFVHCRVPRVDVGVRTIKTPRASASNRYTDAFERWAINLFKRRRTRRRRRSYFVVRWTLGPD